MRMTFYDRLGTEPKSEREAKLGVNILRLECESGLVGRTELWGKSEKQLREIERKLQSEHKKQQKLRRIKRAR